MRLAIVASHPIQYQAPLFRELASRLDLVVFFACRASPKDQAAAGFGVAFDWDVDLTSGYLFRHLENLSKRPGPSHFAGCDTPAISEEIRGGGFDAVLVLGWHLKSFWQAILAAKRAGVPLLVRGDSQLSTPRSLAKRLAKEIIYRPGLRLFDGALYVGRHSRDYFLHYGYPASRLFFSPHCIDTQWFAERATSAARNDLRRRLGVGQATKLALFAGKLVDFKRPLDLVAALAQVRAGGGNVELLLAGAGPLQGRLQEEASRLDVPIHELGFCNQTEMPAAYAAADVLVLPSNGRETWGLVANEAQASGIPIVVSDECGCAPDLAADGHIGRSFPMGDIHALSQALVEVFADAPTQQEVREFSRNYSVAAACDGIEAAVMAQRPPRRSSK